MNTHKLKPLLFFLFVSPHLYSMQSPAPLSQLAAHACGSTMEEWKKSTALDEASIRTLAILDRLETPVRDILMDMIKPCQRLLCEIPISSARDFSYEEHYHPDAGPPQLIEKKILSQWAFKHPKFSPCGNKILTNDYYGLRVFNASNGKLLVKFQNPHQFAFNGDASWSAQGNYVEKSACVWNACDGSLVYCGPTWELSITHNEKYTLYYRWVKGVLGIVNLSTQQLCIEVPAERPANYWDQDPDTKYIFAQRDKCIDAYDATNLQLVGTFPKENSLYSDCLEKRRKKDELKEHLFNSRFSCKNLARFQEHRETLLTPYTLNKECSIIPVRYECGQYSLTGKVLSEIIDHALINNRAFVFQLPPALDTATISFAQALAYHVLINNRIADEAECPWARNILLESSNEGLKDFANNR